MRQPFEPPALTVVSSGSLSLSNSALIVLARAVLGKDRPFRFQAPGSSMEPFINDGDVLTIVPFGQRPGVGRVVAFIHPLYGKFVVHRVVAVKLDTFLIRGDAIPDGSDGWVPFDQILGQVIRVERGKQDIRLGLGPERRLIAFFSARGWLVPLRFSPIIQALRRKVTR